MKTDWQTTAIEIQQGGVNQSWEDFTADRGIIFNPLTLRSNFLILLITNHTILIMLVQRI